jgi:ribonuclease HI
MVTRPLSLKVYFDGGCAPNPGAMRTAVVMRGVAHLDLDAGDGSSGEVQWLGQLDALRACIRGGVFQLGYSPSNAFHRTLRMLWPRSLFGVSNANKSAGISSEQIGHSSP